ncbi:Zinc knuckle [Carpediemonas membranifera]|uniref:Zinc knuckle n=1 Tax=Carpediemonas membranifera TaxID=201153 RepID=A0A8J6B4W5_9EUKA|nr:Zinc knuckle [Carpediemonas membranifera]|eukprot:KAG9394354.1 Zinc knuckle [Carpediemonas membranifera]
MTFKNKEKAVPPLFRDPSMKALLDFYLHLQTYRSLGGKADISELVDPSIADYVSQCIDEAGNSEDDDYVPLLMATTERRRQKRNFSDLRILKRLGSVLRPSRSTAQLDLFRLRAKTFDPVEVNNVNRKFKALPYCKNG